jgi:hypothetical protein
MKTKYICIGQILTFFLHFLATENLRKNTSLPNFAFWQNFPSKQKAATRGFFSPVLWGMWSGNAPEEDSDNFGYRSENK